MEGATQKTKRQHFVPRSYLSRFCDERQQIWTYDKFERRSFKTSIWNVAQENYFYEASVGEADIEAGVDPQIFEKLLGKIENLYKAPIDECLANLSEVGARYAQLVTLAHYVAIQWMRTKEYRETVVDLHMETMRSFAEELIEKNWPGKAKALKPSIKVSPNCDAALHLVHLFSNDSIKCVADYLAEYIWIVGLSDHNHPFVTSDHPVVRRANCRDELGPLVGLRCPGVEFAFPLAPNAILLMLERTYFGRLADNHCQAVRFSEEQVLYCNSLQVKKSYRQVFSSKSDFSFVEGICHEHPEVCDPHRSRVEVTVTQTGPMKSRTDVRILD